MPTKDNQFPVVTHVNLQQDFRGGERQTLLLIEGLQKSHQLKQQIVVRAGSELHKRTQHLDGIQVIPIRKPFFLSLPRAKHADLLHAHEAKAAQWCYLFKKCYNTPYIIHRRVTHKPKDLRITRAVYKHATYIISLSRAITGVLHSFEPNLPVKRIPSMFSTEKPDLEQVEMLRQKYKGKYLVGHVGALVDSHKGQSCLIETAKKLVANYPDMHFLLLGEGKDRAKLERQAQGIEQIEFVGFQAMVQNYLAIFDLFAFPSKYEGLGSSIIDAMHFHLPIVASAVEGITDLIQDEETGLLFPSEKPDVLAECIERVYQDSKLSAQLGKQAGVASKSYDQKNISKKVYALYQSILHSPLQ